MKRREFIKQTGLTAAGTTVGAELLGKAIEAINLEAPPVAAEGGKQASSVLSLPKGGGSVKGIGETFQPNPFTGSGNFSVPVFTSPARGGMNPKLSLQYSTGQGNGPFGLGWNLSVPMISRKTEKGIPVYDDSKDTFVLSGAEDLVPYLKDGIHVTRMESIGGTDWQIFRYRPRVEGLHALIEFWKPGDLSSRTNKAFWRVVSKENLTSVYGYTASTKLAASDRNNKIFAWQLELSYDVKGNAIWYQYKSDYGLDLSRNIPIHERHRYTDEKNADPVQFQLYLKSIHYGNLQPLQSDQFSIVQNALAQDFRPEDFLFTVLFDFGEHKIANPELVPADRQHQFIADDLYSSSQRDWGTRSDAFSSYRAGFEVRTYRRCERVLMFHQTPAYPQPLLVRSTDFHYEANTYNELSMLVKVVQRGYRRLEDSQIHRSEEVYLDQPGLISRQYAIKSFPPVTFKYSGFQPDQQQFIAMRGSDGDMPDKALTNPDYALVDIFGSGLPDVLHSSAAGYFYWKNKGNGTFASRRSLKTIPNNIRLSQAGVGFGDMAGNGQADLLVHTGAQWGFFETNGTGGWKNFKYYQKQPSFSLNDPQTRMFDLEGSGKAGALSTTDNSFWYTPCLGEEGFGAPVSIRRKRNLEEFPDVNFTDPRVKLADLSGDGLNDMVLVHSGRIDYWPNIGYGKFGKRITLANTPRLPLDFDPQRLILIDIDGSGPADLVYLEHDRIRFWFNQSGNQFSQEFSITGTPPITNAGNIVATDMLGNGTNGLLWTNDFPGAGRSHYRFLDFSGGVKPNLLVDMSNSMGAITKVSYTPSTAFYLEDEKNGGTSRWISLLPFPVQCVQRVEQLDLLSGTRLLTRYAYHHGYYDGREREFRGFAFVEQWDEESFDDFKANSSFVQLANNQQEAFRIPPVHTKTWYHTGAYNLDELPLLAKTFNASNNAKHLDLHALFRRDYYRGDSLAFQVDPCELQAGTGRLDTYAISEAWRTLRGSVLRQEVFADDKTSKAKHPYTVTESSYSILQQQAKGSNNHAVYQLLPQESITFHYERVPDYPRVSQSLTLATDQYGNPTKTVAIAYPNRDKVAHPDQLKLYATLSETAFINPDEDNPQTRYLGIPYLGTSFQLGGLAQALLIDDVTEKKISRTALKYLLSDDVPILPHARELTKTLEASGLVKRRLSEKRTYFKTDTTPELTEIEPGDTPIRVFDARLPLGTIGQLGLPYEEYTLAFEEEALLSIFQSDFSLAELSRVLKKGGYIQLDDLPSQETFWWAPSGQQSFDRQKFYQTSISVDPWGYASTVFYDQFHLLPIRSEDAFGNEIRVKNDYITLQAHAIRDENHNGSKVAFDAMGLVTATAVMGKLADDFSVVGTIEGDSLQGFTPKWEYDDDFHQYIDSPFLQNPLNLLQTTTTVILHDLWRPVRLGITAPPVVWSAKREEHNTTNTSVQQVLLYFDGLGRELQTKIEADPAPTDPQERRRWIASGRKTYNNKGLPVKQYEPFYTITPDYESSREEGCSSVLFYDPLGRMICTIHPNHTFEKVFFSPWEQHSWDVNDTLDLHPGEDTDVNQYVLPFLSTYQHCLDGRPFSTWQTEMLNSGDQKKIRTAVDASRHANTPATAYLDTLGQTFLTVARNGLLSGDEQHTYSKLDIQGNELFIIDPRQMDMTLPTKAFVHQFDLLNRKIVVNSMDAGLKTMLPDISGQPLWSKDANMNILVYHYDRLRRPTELRVQELGTGTFKLKGKTTYGEDIVDTAIAFNANLRGKVWQVFDGAGRLENDLYDFKGNVLKSTRVLLSDKAIQVNWAETNDPFSETSLSPNIAALNTTKPFHSHFSFDALNRIMESVLPDGSTKRPIYNKTNQLKSLEVTWVDTALRSRVFVKDIAYNAKGQRLRIQYNDRVGNLSFTTTYTYERETYRLTRLTTKREADETHIQDLNYTYDPVGNITHIEDKTIASIWTCNQRVDGLSYYQYDALYRLVLATGREHRGQNRDAAETIRFKQLKGIPLPPPCTDRHALRWYTEAYNYDKAGNLLEKRHFRRLPNNVGVINGNPFWKVVQVYATDSNRIQSATSQNQTVNYSHDTNGNITSLKMGCQWNYANELVQITLDASGAQAHYQYDLQGNRTRKWLPNTGKSRTYLADYEIYEEANKEGCHSIGIMDDQQRIATLDLPTSTDNTRQGKAVIRYQLSNHLGSATKEVDDSSTATLISIEEYYPYGGTSISFSNNTSTCSLKRYRYSGKERDEESGLYYYGARYYSPWMGRWMSCDPAGRIDGENLYESFLGNPITNKDDIGLNTTSTSSTSSLTINNINSSSNFLQYSHLPQERIDFSEKEGSKIVVDLSKSKESLGQHPNENGLSQISTSDVASTRQNDKNVRLKPTQQTFSEVIEDLDKKIALIPEDFKELREPFLEKKSHLLYWGSRIEKYEKDLKTMVIGQHGMMNAVRYRQVEGKAAFKKQSEVLDAKRGTFFSAGFAEHVDSQGGSQDQIIAISKQIEGLVGGMGAGMVKARADYRSSAFSNTPVRQNNRNVNISTKPSKRNQIRNSQPRRDLRKDIRHGRNTNTSKR